MKITGTVDVKDRIEWINWYIDNPRRGKHPWRKRLYGLIALVLPPLLFRLLGHPFHWETYVGVIVCWALLRVLWRFVQLFVARRKTKRENDSYSFKLERRDQTICLSARGRILDYPSDKVGAIRYKHNIILTMDDCPICITPRNENIDGGNTIDDIENMIKEIAEPAHEH